jgi:hypothetical protein
VRTEILCAVRRLLSSLFPDGAGRGDIGTEAPMGLSAPVPTPSSPRHAQRAMRREICSACRRLMPALLPPLNRRRAQPTPVPPPPASRAAFEVQGNDASMPPAPQMLLMFSLFFRCQRARGPEAFATPHPGHAPQRYQPSDDAFKFAIDIQNIQRGNRHCCFSFFPLFSREICCSSSRRRGKRWYIPFFSRAAQVKETYSTIGASLCVHTRLSVIMQRCGVQRAWQTQRVSAILPSFRSPSCRAPPTVTPPHTCRLLYTRPPARADLTARLRSFCQVRHAADKMPTPSRVTIGKRGPHAHEMRVRSQKMCAVPPSP